MYRQVLAAQSKSVNHSAKLTRNSSSKDARRERVFTLATKVNESSSEPVKRELSWVYCREKHKLIECEEFKSVDLDSKRDVIRKIQKV